MDWALKTASLSARKLLILQLSLIVILELRNRLKNPVSSLAIDSSKKNPMSSSVKLTFELTNSRVEVIIVIPWFTIEPMLSVKEQSAM